MLSLELRVSFAETFVVGDLYFGLMFCGESAECLLHGQIFICFALEMLSTSNGILS